MLFVPINYSTTDLHSKVVNNVVHRPGNKMYLEKGLLINKRKESRDIDTYLVPAFPAHHFPSLCLVYLAPAKLLNFAAQVCTLCCPFLQPFSAWAWVLIHTLARTQRHTTLERHACVVQGHTFQQVAENISDGGL